MHLMGLRQHAELCPPLTALSSPLHLEVSEGLGACTVTGLSVPCCVLFSGLVLPGNYRLCRIQIN